MPTSTTALRILATHRSLGRDGEGPENVRVFSGDDFLFASFDHGREQILDVRAYDRLDMIRIYIDWYRVRVQIAARSQRPARTPHDPARDNDREPGPEQPARPAQSGLTITSSA